MSTPEDAPTKPPRQGRSFAKPLIIVALSVIAGYLVVELAGQVDWQQVAHAFTKFSWWQIAILIVLVAIRQVFNALPLATFVPGLGVMRSLDNDLAANVIGTITPPPGDMVIRVAMFNSWNINPIDGMAGVTMNMLNFYAVRLLCPVIGLAVFVGAGIEAHRTVWALLCALGAVALLLILAMVLRAEDWADRLGRSAAASARRFKATADPDKWSAAVTDFRARMATGFVQRSAKSVASLIAMVAVDAVVLLLALRFVGISSSSVGGLLVIGTFFMAYPLTTMPLFGFGILDAVLVSTYVESAGEAWEPEIIAAVAVWRALTILGPLLVGAVTVFLWRRRTGTDLNLWGGRHDKDAAVPAS